jgi:putative transposase
LTNGIFLYVLGVAARRFGVQVHAYCVLSNHFHLVVTDPLARLPAFEQYLASLVARAVNASLGRWESLWAPSSYSAVALATPDDIVAKCAYVLANPVAAGLVRRGRDWPGLWSAPEQLCGASILAARPTTFFRASGYMPDSAELELATPPGFASPEEFRVRLVEALAAFEEGARREIMSSGRGFIGPRRVLAQSPRGRPASVEVRRQLNPRVAARDRWKRLEALSRVLEFIDAYREALRAFRAGLRDAVFPAGTYLLRVAHGVQCAACA